MEKKKDNYMETGFPQGFKGWGGPELKDSLLGDPHSQDVAGISVVGNAHLGLFGFKGLKFRHHMDCSQNYGPLLSTDLIAAPNM